MFQRIIRIPKHGGPDGVGLPQSVFDELLEMLNTDLVNDIDAQQAIDLCFNISKQEEWNNIYQKELITRYRKL